VDVFISYSFAGDYSKELNQRGGAGVAAGPSWTQNLIDFAHCSGVQNNKFFEFNFFPETKL
jgi:hypothetical protein